MRAIFAGIRGYGLIKLEKLIFFIFVVVFVAACGAEKIKDDTGRVTVGTVYKSDGKGDYISVQKDQAACMMMRRQTLDVIARCKMNTAETLKLSVTQCNGYFLEVANQCAGYVDKKYGADNDVKSCRFKNDVLAKCTSVLLSGCKYSKNLAISVESVAHTKIMKAWKFDDRGLFEANVRSNCLRPDPLRTLDLVRRGALKVDAYGTKLKFEKSE